MTTDPRATRNLGLLMVATGGLISWRSILRWSSLRAAHPFKAAAIVSLGVALAVLGLLALWGWIQRVKHRD